MSSKSLQPIICCLGDSVGGNPTQFVFERALIDRGLTDWKLFTAEVKNEETQAALGALKLLGIQGVCLITEQMRKLVLGPQVQADPEAVWCGRVSLLLRIDTIEPETRAAGPVESLLPSQPVWEGTFTVGNAVLQALLQLEVVDPLAMNCLVLGDSPEARSVVASALKKGTGKIFWLVDSSAQPLEDTCPDGLKVFLQEACQNERLMLVHDLSEAMGPDLHATIVCEEKFVRNFEKWLNTQSSPEQIRVVDARSSVISISELSLPLPVTVAITRTTDWHAKMLEEDFLRLTGVAPNSVVVRDALDEYMEL